MRKRRGPGGADGLKDVRVIREDRDFTDVGAGCARAPQQGEQRQGHPWGHPDGRCTSHTTTRRNGIFEPGCS